MNKDSSQPESMKRPWCVGVEASLGNAGQVVYSQSHLQCSCHG